MASPESRTLELRVGIFVLIGLAAIGYMVVRVSRLSNSLASYYSLTVMLPDASGLLKNSKVLMAGAMIGSVADSPQVANGGRGVVVHLDVDNRLKVPRNARVIVSSSGLMGDRYVDVIAPEKVEGGYFQPGEVVQGTRSAGMDDLQREGTKLIDDMRGAVANFNGTITRLNQDLLKPEMFKNLQDTSANLSATTNNFKNASEKINAVLDDARGAVAQAHAAIDGAKDTLASANVAAVEVQKAIGDARAAISDTRKVLGNVRAATEQAIHGPGLIGTLVSDKEVSANLTALVANLRRSGVLFYRDRAVPTPAPTPTPARSRH